MRKLYTFLPRFAHVSCSSSSHSAELNAENILMLASPVLADAYSGYVDHLVAKYGGA